MPKPARRRRGGRKSRAVRRAKLALAACLGLGMLGTASAGAAPAVIRLLPGHEALEVAVDTLVTQPTWIFAIGLVTGIWLRHEKNKPEPKLPFPFVAVRRGVSPARRTDDALED